MLFQSSVSSQYGGCRLFKFLFRRNKKFRVIKFRQISNYSREAKSGEKNKLILVYLLTMAVGFGVIYGLLGVREFGLYLSLGALNFPSSLIVFPLLERMAEAAGISIGGWTHVWALQITSMLVNCALIASTFSAFRHLRRSGGRGKHSA